MDIRFGTDGWMEVIATIQNPSSIYKDLLGNELGGF
jgi:hypothetical protein